MLTIHHCSTCTIIAELGRGGVVRIRAASKVVSFTLASRMHQRRYNIQGTVSHSVGSDGMRPYMEGLSGVL